MPKSSKYPPLFPLEVRQDELELEARVYVFHKNIISLIEDI